jgi:hypothetical protein
MDNTVVVLANGQQQKADGMYYEDATLTATRSEAQGKNIVTLHGKVNKQMLVDNNNKCLAYCPKQGKFFSVIQPNKKATQITTSPIAWQWYDDLIIVHMDRKVLTYASDGTTPVSLFEDITPFGAASIGNGTQTFSQFKIGADASKFAVTGIENCPLSSGCQQDRFWYLKH